MNIVILLAKDRESVKIIQIRHIKLHQQDQSLTLASLPISKHSWRLSLSLWEAVMGLKGDEQQINFINMTLKKNRSYKMLYKMKKQGRGK